MAAPKAFLLVGGITIIEREIRALGSVFNELLVVANDTRPYAGLGVRAIPDPERFRAYGGPLTGLYGGLLAAANDYVFLAACDMPFIEPGLARWMAGQRDGHEVVIPRVKGLAEPLFGLYKKTAIPIIESALIHGTRKLQDALRLLDVRYVDEDEMRVYDRQLNSLTNVNTPDELARAEETALNLSGL